MTRALLLLALLAAAAPKRARADDAMPVTTDTPEYCLSLANQIVAQDMTPSVRSLWAKGRQLCEHGHVQDGLAYMRHAMLMTRSAR